MLPSPREATQTRRLLKKSAVGVRVLGGVVQTVGMQGKSDPNPELLDAAALCRHLVADDRCTRFWRIIA